MRRSRRSRPTFPRRDTTTPCTARTSRSPRSTSAGRPSTACATTRGAGRRPRRPRARWSPGPTASRTSVTTSRTRCGRGSSCPTTCPPEVRDVVGSRSSEQIGTFVVAVLDAIDRTGHVGMTEPAASALAAFRAFNFDRIYLRPAARRQAEKVIRLLRGLVDHFGDAPHRIPDAGRDRPRARRGLRSRRGGGRPLRERHDRPVRTRPGRRAAGLAPRRPSPGRLTGARSLGTRESGTRGGA